MLEDKGLKPVAQEQSFWCWAASTQMLNAFFNGGNGVRQCEQAANELKKSASGEFDCCNHYVDDCDIPAWPRFPDWGDSVVTRAHCLPSWSELVSELKGESTGKPGPFAISTEYPGDIGKHMLVVAGFAFVEQTRLILLWDPYKPGYYSWKDFETWRRGDSTFSIGRDFHRISQSTGTAAESDEGDTSCSAP